MMKKSLFCMTAALFALPTVTSAASPYFSLKDGDGFKRFSVSAGWLHAMPQGSGNPVNINTSVAEGTKSKVGDVSTKAVLDASIKVNLQDNFGIALLAFLISLQTLFPHHLRVQQKLMVFLNGNNKVLA